ncbi:MAG: hypothetical protein ABI554_10965 [Flavobacterium sp.]
MFTEIEQQALDIDWFFTDNKEVGFVASGAGKLPKSFAKIEKHDLLVSYFRNLPETSDFSLNNDLNNILPHEIDDEYLCDFIFMSKRGLYSFDKTVLNNFNEPNYHLVTKPQNPLNFIDLPHDIKEILCETVFNGNLNEILNIDVSKIQ